MTITPAKEIILEMLDEILKEMEGQGNYRDFDWEQKILATKEFILNFKGENK